MEEPDWTRHSSDVLIWHMPGEETAAPKKKPVLKTAASVGIIFSALITGSTFGFLMMSAVPKQAEEETASRAPAVTAPAEQAQQPQQTSVEKAVSLFIVQGGMYSTAEAAQQAAASSGQLSAVIPSDGQYSMIYGAFFTKSEADDAEKRLEADGAAAYVKETKATVTSEEEEALRKAAASQQLDQMATILSP